MRHGEGTFVGNSVSHDQLNGQRDQFFDELKQLARQGRMLGIDAAGLHALHALHALLDDALTLSQNQDTATDTSAGETQ